MADLSRFPLRADARPSRRQATTEDKYDRILIDNSNFAAQGAMLQERDPVTVLRARQVAREANVPAPLVEREYDNFARQALEKKTRDAIRQDPWLAEWFGKPDNAAAGRDDVERLSNISRMVSNAPTTKTNMMGETALGSSILPALGMSTRPQTSLRNTYSGWTARPAETFTEQASRIRAQAEGEAQAREADRPMLNPQNVLRGWAAGTAANVAGAALGAEQFIFDALGVGDTQEMFAGYREDIEDFRDRYTPGGLDNALARGLYSGGQSLTDLGFTAMFGGAAILPGLTGIVGGNAYTKYRGRGATPNQALVGAGGEAAVEYLTERMPVSYLLGRFGKEGAGNFLTGFLVPELLGEQVATLAQDAIDTAIANPNKTWAEYWAERPGAQLETLIATGAMVGTIGSVAAVQSRLRREDRDLERAADGVTGAQFLDQLMGEAQQSQMRQLDPESFREFIEQRTEGTPVQNLYVPIEAINEYMQSEGYEPGFLETYQDQIREAQTTNGDIVIPVADAAARMAGSPAWEALKEQVRLQPGGLSMREAEERRVEITTELEQRGRELAEAGAADGETLTATAEVYNEVKNELLSIGRSSAEAENIAQLYAASREAWAQRLGMSPLEYHRANPIAFTDGTTGARAGGERAFAQITPEQVRELNTPLELPTDPLFMEAVTNTASAEITPDGLRINLVRVQKPEQEGAQATRTGVFYLPKGSPNLRHYSRGGSAYGGPEKFEGETLIRRPLFVKGATGGKAPEAAYDALKGKGSAKKLEREIFGAINQRHWMAKTDPGVFEEALGNLLEEYGVERWRTFDIINNSREGNQLRYAVQEIIIAHAIREAGYDAMVGYSKGKNGASISEVFDVREQSYPAREMESEIHENYFQTAEILYQDGVIEPDVRAPSNNNSYYHGSQNEIKGALRSSENGLYGPGVYLSNREDVARDYGGPGATVTQYSISGPLASDADFTNALLDAQAEGYTRFEKRVRAHEILKEQGFVGIEDSPVTVVFDPENVTRIYEQGPRGSASFYPNGDVVISLFESANLSTLIHETGHVFLEELQRNASANNAPQDVKEDWAKVKGWFAVNGHPVKKGEIPRDAHEMFARGFERYAMEGKAPSEELRGAFATFRAWLLRIYQVVQNLRAPITPEIRDVFDRMLATQEAIEAAREDTNAQPLFKTAEEAGMTEAEFAAYRETIEGARNEAYDALLFRTMEAIRRRENKKMQEQRANVRAEVAAEINARPEFIALHLLRTGRWLGDPERAPVNIKLNSGWLIDTFGEDVLDRLPKGPPIRRGDGVDGDVVAEIVGMASGEELVNALILLRQASDELRAAGETRSVRDKMIDDEVDRVMAERHGDPLLDGKIEEEAIAAINTARQGEIIAGEIRQLAKRNNALGAPTPYQFAREWARRKIVAGRVQEVASRAALQRYTRAAAKAARAAERAILEENVDEAFRQKQAQLLNHALLAEAKIAADQVDAIVQRMSKLAKRAAMKSVDQDYLDRIHMLLERYDFRPRSQKSIDEYEGFAAWVADQRAKGFEVHIPPRLQARGEHYSRVTVEELTGLADLVASLLHLGRTKQKLIDAKGERDFNEWRDEVLERINRLPTRKLPDKPINEEERRGASAAAELLKIETIVEELDGGTTGPLHDLIILGATKAADMRDELRDKVLDPIAKTYKSLPAKYHKRLQEKVTIPELTWNTLNEGDPRLGSPVTITRQELLAIYLNMGNLSNLEKLSKGERWPVPTLRAVIDREFTKEDFDFAQSLWDNVAALWPDIVRVERALSGVVPEQVEPMPIETRFGTYSGGYWPVVYDSARSQRAEDYEGQRLDDMFGMKSGLATQKGHTITRTEAVGPFNLSLEKVLFDHIEQVITRVSYSEYVRETLRALKDRRIKGLIDTKLGPEYRKQIEPWIARQIHEGAVNAKAAKWWQKVMRHARINMTIAAMGFRFSTGVAQTLGLTVSAQRIGAVNVARGLKQMAFNPREAVAFVDARSPEMSRRMTSMNRDVAEVFNRLRGKYSWLTEAQAWAFWHIGMIDRYVVAIPTWLGAHTKGMAEGMTDAEASAYADKSVRLSQGSGREKDLSAIQSPNNDAMRFFTMFYTPFNVMFNAQWQGVRGLKRGDPRAAIGVTFWWLIASTLADALLSGDWPEDDEGDGWTGGIMEWFARNVFFGAFAGLPLIRDAANYGERKLAGEYTTLSTPVARVIETVEKAAVSSYKIATGEGEEINKPIKQGGEIAAVLFGLPTGQVGTTAQYLWDYGEGEADPETISDFYFGITRGKEPEE